MEIQLNFLEDSNIKRSTLIQNFYFTVDVGAALKILLRSIGLFQVVFLDREYSLFLCVPDI